MAIYYWTQEEYRWRLEDEREQRDLQKEILHSENHKIGTHNYSIWEAQRWVWHAAKLNEEGEIYGEIVETATTREKLLGKLKQMEKSND